MSTTVAVNPYTALNPTAAASSVGKDPDAADRFLKLLVTQMQNQDPLNPMDNAQVTSQMAQISTVSGIEKLNDTVAGLNGNMLQMQALQGATLVGRHVTLQGTKLAFAEGQGAGGFELASAADQVKVDILNGAGHTVQTLQLGAASAGRSGFVWDAGELPDGGTNYSFRIRATSGGTALPSTPLMFDKVLAVSSDGQNLQLETLNSGVVAYRDVKAIN